LADALFSTSRQRVLGLLFGQPDRSFYATELINLTAGGSGAVQRELAKLEATGLVVVTRQGTQKHYRANPDSPVFGELCGIARKTFGMTEPLREALAPVADRIRAAFVYGSVAKRSDTALSDIDLMIVSDTLSHQEIFMSLAAASAKLGREVNPTIFTTAEMESHQRERNSFITRVLAQPKLWILGGEHALSA
jgi:predicted nucleotidyltransferase